MLSEDKSMRKFMSGKTRRIFSFCFVFAGLAVVFIVLPSLFHSKARDVNPVAASKIKENKISDELANYDIRTDKTATDKIIAFRRSQNKTASKIADVRDDFVKGEEKLKRSVPTLNVEYNSDLRTPEVIAPDIKKGRRFLTGAARGVSNAEALRNFVEQNNDLVGVAKRQADTLKVTADYTNPDGNLSFASLEQFINDVPVFRGEVKAGFTKNGEMIRVINNLAPGLDYAALSDEFGDPAEAVKNAAAFARYDLKQSDLSAAKSDSGDSKIKFGEGDWAPTAEKIYFPTEPGVAVPAWRVLLWKPDSAYYVIVDAETGTMLWRKNIVEHQTQSATYNVYTNPNAMINVAESPAPLTPGPITLTGAQGALISRNNVTLVGNEAPYTFNNNGWITDGGNTTDGNAVEAGPDRVAPDGVDAPVTGSSNRSFIFNYNPSVSQGQGDAPLGAESQKGGVTQLFYIINRFHDEMYLLGFTEQARNFQHNNFGRGGFGSDRLSAQAQDNVCASTNPNAPPVTCANNANFGTPADGSRPRMQMFLWTAPEPDRDGALDADIVVHEYTHGISNRLHGNASGLSSVMARGMGEGWSDFYAHAMLSEPSDPVDGVYSSAGYSHYLRFTGFNTNYYYGGRRFPKAIMSAVGGPNNRPHNPLTFADVDSTQLDVNDGAFARGPLGSNIADQVHAAGEVWSTALWEVRGKFIARLGWADGNRRVLQYVTDGMKLAPLAPTFLQERDAIIAAAQASLPPSQANVDVADIWEGFRIRGMGFSAKVLKVGSADAVGNAVGETRVIEAFDAPNLVPDLAVSAISETTGDNDGFFEPGETVTLNVPLSNNTGLNATGVVLQIIGGAAVNYGAIFNNSSATQSISYKIPADTACGDSITLMFNVSSNLGVTSFTRVINVGEPVVTYSENFDGVTAPALPTGWTAASISDGVNFVTTNVGSYSEPNSAFALNPATVGGGTDLTSPPIPITAPSAMVIFRNKYDTEPGWDGGVLEISINNGEFQDIIAAGGRFIEGGYNVTLGAGDNNPLSDRPAWSGKSNGYITTKAQLPAAAAGKNIRLRWRFGADDNTGATGWNIDSVQVAGTLTCNNLVAPSAKAPFDFDGDKKTDLSIFRPLVGEWWYLKSSNGGNGAFQFGSTTDKLVPADFTGDGKTDIAFFRPQTGEWFVLRSEDSSFYSFPFGANGDVPVPSDFDADGKADPAVFRPSTNTWFISKSTGGTTIQTFGQTGDVPVVADYDGDNKADIAIYRPSKGEWWLQRSNLGAIAFQFGNSTDKPVQGDYTGDGKADVAFFRPQTGEWFILRSENQSYYSFPFGTNGDVPSPGEYDGDGKSDAAVFRPANNTWYVQKSTSGALIQTFGQTGDKPVPSAFVP
jgi:hypothetical protein